MIRSEGAQPLQRLTPRSVLQLAWERPCRGSNDASFRCWVKLRSASNIRVLCIQGQSNKRSIGWIEGLAKFGRMVIFPCFSSGLIYLCEVSLHLLAFTVALTSCEFLIFRISLQTGRMKINDWYSSHFLGVVSILLLICTRCNFWWFAKETYWPPSLFINF